MGEILNWPSASEPEHAKILARRREARRLLDESAEILSEGDGEPDHGYERVLMFVVRRLSSAFGSKVASELLAKQLLVALADNYPKPGIDDPRTPWPYS